MEKIKNPKEKLAQAGIIVITLWIGFMLGSIFTTFLDIARINNQPPIEEKFQRVIRDIRSEIARNWSTDTLVFDTEDLNSMLGTGSRSMRVIIEQNDKRFYITNGDTLFVGYYRDNDPRWLGIHEYELEAAGEFMQMESSFQKVGRRRK